MICQKLCYHQNKSTEEEMYNNQYSSDLFDNFLKIIGTKIELNGWTGFRAGLDVRTGSTGKNSVHTVHKDTEIMFHVSTMLPFSKVHIKFLRAVNFNFFRVFCLNCFIKRLDFYIII